MASSSWSSPALQSNPVPFVYERRGSSLPLFWYFALGVFVTLLIVQTALWFAADEDEKPSQWATLPAWFGIFQSIGCIRKARENRKQSAE